MRRPLKNMTLALVAGLALTACATRTAAPPEPDSVVQSTVTRTHAIPAVYTTNAETGPEKGHSVAVVPYVKNHGGPEQSATYAKQIERAFEGAGYTIAATPEAADYMAYFHYGVDGARGGVPIDKLPKEAGETFEQVQDGLSEATLREVTFRRSRGFGRGFGGFSMFPTQRRFARFFQLDLVPTRATEVQVQNISQEGPGTLSGSAERPDRKVFAGMVFSAGRVDNFHTVSNCLIAAMFKGFPGKASGSEHVTQRLGDCDQAAETKPTEEVYGKKAS